MKLKKTENYLFAINNYFVYLFYIFILYMVITTPMNYGTFTEKIPKIIHQIWIGPKTPPYLWIDTWKNDYMKMFSSFKYFLWDEFSALNILKKYPKIHALYNIEKTWHGKADILRYIILLEYGGIHIDADSVWINDKDLTELIDSTNSSGVFAAKEPTSVHITNGVIGSTKQNKLIKWLVDELQKITPRRYRNLRKWKGVSKVTGPLFFNKLQTKKITIFPTKYFYPIVWSGINDINLHKKIKLPEESYMFQYGLTTNNLEY